MLREITDNEEWDKLLSQAQVASGRFLQSWEWGEFHRSIGRLVRRFELRGCLGQLIELPLPFGKKYWLCPKGPLAVPGAALHLDRFIGALAEEAKKVGAIFLRLEPQEIPAGVDLKTTKQVNPSCTAIINISKSEEDILAAMHPKTRYNIRVAEKHGVLTTNNKQLNSKQIDEMMNLFEETAKRDGFRLHPRPYYEAQVKMPNVAVFGAMHASKLLAAAIVIFDPSTPLGTGGVATYLHGASSNESRNLMAPYALHWAIIKEAKARGSSRYDLWGISDAHDSGWAGITRFKRGWGVTESCVPGTRDLPVKRFWYSVYRLVRRMRP
jgi:peptidoglycan pentaglycine glycine transferase (the first glycine)